MEGGCFARCIDYDVHRVNGGAPDVPNDGYRVYFVQANLAVMTLPAAIDKMADIIKSALGEWSDALV